MSEESAPEVQQDLMKGIMAAAGAALVVGLIYGVVGMFVNEFKWLALATGAASGVAGVTFGKKYSIPLGVAAAVFTLIGMIVGKLLIQPGEGGDWFAYHTTLFDIMFCYVGAPALAFIAAGTQGGDYVKSYLPINR